MDADASFESRATTELESHRARLTDTCLSTELWMTWTRTYGHFAAAYGTCMLTLLALSGITAQHIDAGPLGFWGFLIVGLAYAVWRRRIVPDQARLSV